MERVTPDTDGIGLDFGRGAQTSILWEDICSIDAHAVDTITTEYAFLTLNHANGDFLEFDERTAGFWDLVDYISAHLGSVEDARTRISLLEPDGEPLRLFERTH